MAPRARRPQSKTARAEGREVKKIENETPGTTRAKEVNRIA
tara:strand:+ start:405 stop:527 length:123 start_codon:yes stop_codon:yes gene_type:complete